MEGNITHIWLKTKRALYGESHLSAWWKGINSTNLCTQLYIFSLLPVAPIFPLQSWSYHRRTHNIILYHWTHFITLLKCHKSTAVLRLGLQTVKISQSFSIFEVTLLSTCYFIIIIPLDASYFNIISLFNKHDLTNTSLMNIHK